MKFREDYFIGVGEPWEGKSIAISVYLTGKGQLSINIKNAQGPVGEYPIDPLTGVNMDLINFYKLVSVLDEIKDELYFEEEDHGERQGS